MGGINSVGNIRSDINDEISSQQEADKHVTLAPLFRPLIEGLLAYL